MRVIVLVVALASAGCLRQTEYQCSGAGSCGANGQCEATGYCSVADAECTSGRRYHEAAGTLGGRCVDGEVSADAALPRDGAVVDGEQVDATLAGCPAGYATLPGGQAGHMYKVIAASDDWDAQHAACKLTTAQAYLAVPDDMAELEALDTAIGGAAVYWVGISDIAAENVWKTVLGDTQTFLPWLPPAPDNQNPGEHCVAAFASLHKFNDDRCNSNMPAICECAP